MEPVGETPMWHLVGLHRVANAAQERAKHYTRIGVQHSAESDLNRKRASRAAYAIHPL